MAKCYCYSNIIRGGGPSPASMSTRDPLGHEILRSRRNI